MSDGPFDRRTLVTVARLIDEVRKGGDASLRTLTLMFDGARRLSIEVREGEWSAGIRAVDAVSRAALRLAARRIADFARLQRQSIRPYPPQRGGRRSGAASRPGR